MKARGSSEILDSESKGKGNGTHDENLNGEAGQSGEEEREHKRRERKERAVKEREERVKAERSKVEADIDRSRIGLNKEEGELEFRCAASLPLDASGYWAPLIFCRLVQRYRTMLTDAIRDPQVRL